MLLLAVGIIVVVGAVFSFVEFAGGRTSEVSCPRCFHRASGPHWISKDSEKYVCGTCGKVFDMARK